jgi:hypothetical protein
LNSTLRITSLPICVRILPRATMAASRASWLPMSFSWIASILSCGPSIAARFLWVVTRWRFGSSAVRGRAVKTDQSTMMPAFFCSSMSCLYVVARYYM